jgi:hypothetical protein
VDVWGGVVSRRGSPARAPQVQGALQHGWFESGLRRPIITSLGIATDQRTMLIARTLERDSLVHRFGDHAAEQWPQVWVGSDHAIFFYYGTLSGIFDAQGETCRGGVGR